MYKKYDITTQRISPASAGGGFYLSAQSEYNLRLFGQRFCESPLLVKSRALKVERGYYKYDEKYYYHLNGKVFDGWYYFNDDVNEWQTIAYDSLPENLQHSSLTPVFSYTPEWESETHISDFENTDFYLDFKRSNESNKSKDYDWDDNGGGNRGGGDSWDNDDADWDSDW